MSGASRRWAAVGAASLAIILMTAAATMAQPHPQPRIDPGIPTEPLGGPADGWELLTIPGLSRGAMLGDVWASTYGVVYVWARIPADLDASPGLGEEGEGERLPGPPEFPKVASSVLYRFDGTRWTVALRTPSEAGVALFGAGRDLMFASTEDALGGARLYRFDGASWTREPMPVPVAGRLHTFAGVPGDVYFRVDRVVLRHDGERLQAAYELPAAEAPMRGVVYLGADCQFVMGPQGHWLHHEGAWSEVPAAVPFEDVEDAWGMRDAQGRLQMYAVGTDAARRGMRLWRFDETDATTHAGAWTRVLTDPVAGGRPDLGTGLHLWGVAANEAYATGVVEDEGHMLRFDGTQWLHLVPPVRLGTVHGVWGTPQGVVWFSTEGGNLVRYQRVNQPPDLTLARPSVERLWPPDRRFVPVEITGVTDPDGDAFDIRIVHVTQDEPIITDAVRTACPDAAVRGDRAYLRAEHADGGDGRTYAIEFTATDRLGAAATGHLVVFAPHYLDTPTAPDPTLFNSFGGCPPPSPGRRPLETAADRGALRIRYEIEEPTAIHLGVYDVSGRLRAIVVEGSAAPGVHEVAWNLDRVESGVYFLKLRTRGESLVRRVIVTH